MERQLSFGRPDTVQNPRHWSSAYSLALVVHAVAFALFIHATRHAPVRVGEPDGQPGISAFVMPGPTGTTGTVPAPPKKVEAIQKPAPKRADVIAAKPIGGDELAGGAQAPGVGSAGTGGGDGSTGPVRVGAGEHLKLLKKVVPAYPRTMELARIEGIVIIEALIHRDGTIGDVKVLRSPGPAFEQAAVDAIKQWRYTELPYEAILTATFTFKVPR